MISFEIYKMYVNRPDLNNACIASIAVYAGLLTVIDNSSGNSLRELAGIERVFRPPAPMYCCESYNWISTRF